MSTAEPDPPRGRSRPGLLVCLGARRWSVHPGQTLTVGRDLRCDVVVDDSRVSRRHAEISYDGRTALLRDLGSANGTWLEGEDVGIGAVGPGSVARLGDVRDGPELHVTATREDAPVPPASDDGKLEGRPEGTPRPDPPGPVGPPPERSAVRGAGLRPMAVPTPAGEPGPDVLTIGRGLENDIVVDDLLASRHHARITREGDGFEVVDLGSRNGTYVNGVAIDRAHLGSQDLLTVGHTRFFVRHGQLVASVDEGNITFAAAGLRYVLPDGKQLLDDVSFALEGSGLVAVIGPSGAGKSTLLNALTGARQATAGEVLYDGRDLYDHYADLRHRIGVVPQEDVVHHQLTVRQALRFAAELRFPDDLDHPLREQRVEEVIDELGLSQHASTRIGRLSGGQRKRTSVALELLTQPSLLFLDEPTSGLDPGLDQQVMRTLRGLADGGRTIVVITHSVANLAVCDKVLLLAPGGKVAYFGPPDELLPYFGARDYADVFIRVAGDPDRAKARFELSTAFQRHVSGPLRHRRRPAERPRQREQPTRQQSLASQLSTLVRRHLRVLVADRNYALFMLVLPVVLALLAMAVPGSDGFGAPGPAQFGQLPSTEARQLLVVLIIGAAFMGTAASMRELVGERPIYQRERAVGLSPAAYLGSKLLVLGAVGLLQSVLLVLVLLLRKPPPSGASVLGNGALELILAAAATAWCAAAVGLMLSAYLRSSEQVMMVMVMAVMTQFVLCGGLIPVAGRAVLEQLSWFTPARWGYAAGASTVDLLSILPMEDDPLWRHGPGPWLLALGALALIGLVAAAVTLAKIRRRAPV